MNNLKNFSVLGCLISLLQISKNLAFALIAVGLMSRFPSLFIYNKGLEESLRGLCIGCLAGTYIFLALAFCGEIGRIFSKDDLPKVGHQ